MLEATNKIAAIDIGTNSIHLIIVKHDAEGNFNIIDREKEVVRLGEGSGKDIKLLQESAIKRALKVLKHYKFLADSHNAKIIAVATSAVREAANKNDFINRVFEQTKINVEVISGNEEARLIYLGILQAIPVYNNKALIIDIGGGSTEFLIGTHGKPIRSSSLKLGAVRLMNRFFPDGQITKSGIERCTELVMLEVLHIIDSFKEVDYSICVGSSGTITAVGEILNANNKTTVPVSLNNFVFTTTQLNEVYESIISKRFIDKIKKIKGLDEKRAEIITAGVIILKTIFDIFKIHEMTISGYALREGIIVNHLQNKLIDETKPKLSDIRKSSVLNLAKRFQYEQKHCKHVAEIALSIFDKTISMHHLSVKCKEYLEAAAFLHDIGHTISHDNHHHHSLYIIQNCDLLGFTQNEINIIANIARYHRKSHPKESHVEFNQLTEEAKNCVRILSAILRVSDSLDRTHKQNLCLEEVNLYQHKVEFLLNRNKDCDPDIELMNFERRKKLFEETFFVKLIIITKVKEPS